MVALAVVRTSLRAPKVCGAPLAIPVTVSVWPGVVRSPVLGSSCRVYTKRPTRTSHTVLADTVCVRLPKVIAGTDACGRRVVSNGFARVGWSGLTHNSSCTLWTSCQAGANRHVSLANTLFCSYVLGSFGSVPG